MALHKSLMAEDYYLIILYVGLISLGLMQARAPLKDAMRKMTFCGELAMETVHSASRFQSQPRMHAFESVPSVLVTRLSYLIPSPFSVRNIPLLFRGAVLCHS